MASGDRMNDEYGANTKLKLAQETDVIEEKPSQY
jgi:hypothetical protein